MRLFKCWNNDICSKEDVMFIWAENELECKEIIANVRSKDKCFKYWLFRENESKLAMELKDNVEVYQSLLEGNFDEYAKAVYKVIDLKNWTIEEYFVPKQSEIFVCYQNDLSEASDVEIVSVPLDVHDIEQYVYQVLAERLAENENFRLYVNGADSEGMIDLFYTDTNGKDIYEFDNYSGNYVIRDDIMDLFDDDLRQVDEFINDCFLKNVHEFFKEEPQYADTYLDYIENHYCDYDTEPEFDMAFYTYCARKIIEDGSYTGYEIERV